MTKRYFVNYKKPSTINMDIKMSDIGSTSPTTSAPHNPMMGEMSKNLKFVGIMYIIVGVITCIGIISAIIGVPMIIAGLRAKDAGEKLTGYLQTGDDMSYSSFYKDLSDHFKMLKIYFIIYLISMILGFLLYGLFFATLIGGALAGID